MGRYRSTCLEQAAEEALLAPAEERLAEELIVMAPEEVQQALVRLAGVTSVDCALFLLAQKVGAA